MLENSNGCKEALVAAGDISLSGRQRDMVEMATEQGFVSVDQLARTYEVTPQTIRRDINYLCNNGLLQRYHGGAGPVGVGEETCGGTETPMLSAVERIASEVARIIPDHASLFLNPGEAGEAIARALGGHTGLRVVTDNLGVAMIVSENESCEVILAGGMVRPGESRVVGEATIDFYQQFKVDFGVIGVSGLEADGALLEDDYLAVQVTRAVMENSREVFLVADHNRFGKSAVVRFGDVADVDVVFTDDMPGENFRKMLKETGVRLQVAEAETP